MAALWTELKTFWDNVQLRQLTNPNSPGATTINDTVGTKAESVAQSIFKRRVGVTADLANNDHLHVLFSAVVYVLELWANKLGDTWRARRDAVYQDMDELRQTTARKRVTPMVPTATEIKNTEDDDLTGTFHRKRFTGIIPGDPTAGTGNPDINIT